MVVVDRLTKYAHFYSISHCFKIRMVDATLMERIKKLYGIPKIIVSDRDPIFIGYFWKEIYYFLGNQLPHNSSTILNLMENIRLWINIWMYFIKNVTIYGTLWLPSSIHHTILKYNDKVQAVEAHIEHQQQFLQQMKDNFAIAKMEWSKHINIVVKGNLNWWIEYVLYYSHTKNVLQATKEGQ